MITASKGSPRKAEISAPTVNGSSGEVVAEPQRVVLTMLRVSSLP